MFQVFENDKPADCAHFNVHASWNNSKFKTWIEAERYAQYWLGIYAPTIGTIFPNIPYFYSVGDFITIKEIKD